MNLDDMFREEEERLVARHRLEAAAEKASWDALSDEERAAVLAAREAKWSAFADACEAQDDDDDDDDDEEEE
jgi:predicted Fe-S protein YdhL (DUF1289 family)